MWPGEHLYGVSGWVCPGVFTQQMFDEQEHLPMAAEQLRNGGAYWHWYLGASPSLGNFVYSLVNLALFLKCG